MTITKEGSLASFYTVNKAPIKHLRVYFSPKQAGTGDPSPDNVREISGWNQLQSIRTNKSIYSFLKTTYTSAVDYYNGYNGWAQSQKIPDRTLYYTYSVYIDNTNCTQASGAQIWFRNIDNTAYTTVVPGNFIPAGQKGWSKATVGPSNFGANSYYVCWGLSIHLNTIASYPMVELGSTMTEYEPYKGSMQTIDWSNDIGTIYGGYVDLITGEVVEEYIKRQVTEFTGVLGECKNGYCAYIYDAAYDHTVSKLNQSYMKCNYFEYSPYGRGAAGGTSNGMPLYTYGGDNGGLGTHGFILPNTITSLAEANAWLDNLPTPLECIIRLKNPNTYTLTPQQLETFVGRNNIWSNADRVEVEYDLAESNDELYRRRNIILQSAPHLESVSGNIANFNTDMIAPIKDAKIYFNPIQEGSGDPSPDNVRNISGWTGCSMYQHGRNLIDKNSLIVGLWWKDIIYSSTYYPNHYRTPLIPVKPGASYYLSRNSGNQDYLSYFDKNQTYVQQVTWSSSKPATKQIPDDIYYVGINIKISEVDSAIFQLAGQDINYTTFISNTTVPINWTSNGTIYGGYVDLINGNLYQEWRKIKLADMTWANFSGKIIYYTTIDSNYSREVQSYVYSDTLTPITDGKLASATVGGLLYYGIGTNYNNEYNRIWTRLPEAMESVDANTWIKETYPDATICYKLATPILVTTLTPQQLLTLRGTNNIWSDANGPVSITYWTH